MNTETHISMYFDAYVEYIRDFLKVLNVRPISHVGDGEKKVYITVETKEIGFVCNLLNRSLKCPHGFYKLVDTKHVVANPRFTEIIFEIEG